MSGLEGRRLAVGAHGAGAHLPRLPLEGHHFGVADGADTVDLCAAPGQHRVGTYIKIFKGKIRVDNAPLQTKKSNFILLRIIT